MTGGLVSRALVSNATVLDLFRAHSHTQQDEPPDIYPPYACRACETISAEPVAPSIIDRGIAAPGLLAQVVIAKYVDHLPLYRQEAIHARSGIELGRTTLAEWIGVVGLRLQPLVDALREDLLAAPVLHADETPVAQLHPGAGQTKRAYLFAYRTAESDLIVVFDYAGNRSGKHAAAFLGHWRGALMVDDYSGYKALFTQGADVSPVFHSRIPSL